MIIQKKFSKKRAVSASSRMARKATRRRIRANEEAEDIEEVDVQEGGVVDVAPEASSLLFEAEDVAQLVAEVTGQDVAVTADEDEIVFEVGDDAYTVEAEGDEEILESTRKPMRGKAPVKASRRVGRRAARARK